MNGKIINNAATLAFMAIVSMFVAAGKAFSQDKIAPYPDFSFQGVFTNPADVQIRGDWIWLGASAKDGAKTAGAEMSYNLFGVQAYGGGGTDGSFFLNASKPISEKLSLGAVFKSPTRAITGGAVYTLQHDSTALMRAGAQYDFGSDAVRLAFERRFRAGKDITLTFSGQITGGKNETGKIGLTDKGLGAQLEAGRVRTSAGFGGKGWRDITLAAQINAGKGFLPEFGVRVPQGHFKKTGVWVGVTKTIPRF